jgi:hypothetical protein
MRNISAIILLIILSFSAKAEPLTPEQAPDALKPWVNWVLQDEKQINCPFLYNNHNNRRCAWPTRLDLTLDGNAGQFSQQWLNYRAGWVTLPGGEKNWPQDVTVDNQPASVVEQGGKPVLWLAEGEHGLRGAFTWRHLPESLDIPLDTGLVALSINGWAIESPDITEQGQLWLRERDTGRKDKAGKGNKLRIQVFRRIIDEVPLRIVTRIELDISGARREELLGRALLDGYIPLRLDSPLPARLEPDGRLRLQVRPGRWSIDLIARSPKDTTDLPLQASPPPWPDSEVWVFDARNHVRLVEIEGVNSVDPGQTNLPPDWRQLPAYGLKAKAKDKMTLKLIRRGDPEPEPDRLTLNRNLWLDFDGQGYTLQDAISGTMTRAWRLDAGEDLMLGQASIDNQPQFITTLPGSKRPGVEVRRGSINLLADSRYQGPLRTLPAVGWNHDFQAVGATLHLPPGWRLFSASGADKADTSWVARWSLLDLFLVLITTVAAARLWSWPWGLLALAALVLTWHEPEAPRGVWLHLLAAIALLRVLPEGRFRIIVGMYRNIALAVLLLTALPFLVNQVRYGLYPQLEEPPPQMAYTQANTVEAPMAPEMMGQEDQANAPAPSSGVASEEAEKAMADSSSSYSYRQKRKVPAKEGQARSLDEYGPKAHIQTGPGLPAWRWTSVDLRWNGPVQRDQEIRLILLPPAMNFFLNLLRVLLVAVFALAMLGNAQWPGRAWQGVPAAIILGLLLFPLPPREAQAADFPGPELLKELKTRLLEPPPCLPACAQSPRMLLEISPELLRMRLEVHAQEAVTIPLPSQNGQWLPAQVMLDNSPARGLSRNAKGQIWLTLPQGVHQVVLSGPVTAAPSFQLPLPLRPHGIKVIASGWQVAGVHEEIPDAQLQFTRESVTEQQSPALEPRALPAFARVERTLRLGLEWRVNTQVVRVSPPGGAVVLEVPLLDGESVTSEGIRVEKGKVQVNLGPQDASTGWESVLKKRDELFLAAPITTAWTELWRAEVGPIWHVVPEGLAVVHHQDPEGNWLPEWHPWPGERVSLKLSRPLGVTGQTLTIEHSRMRLQPGHRATDTLLELRLRSSQGGQHTVSLPANAQLQSVTVNGVSQPIRQEGRKVTLPLTPGTQEVTLAWQKPQGIKTWFRASGTDLGIPSVNSNIEMGLGEDRWVLFAGGPRLGPAVLFWGVLLVIALISVILGRSRVAPLKAHQWLLLGIGLAPTTVWASFVVVGWLIALRARANLNLEISKTRFNLMQVALLLLTILALVLLFAAIKQGLLGQPEMQIAGNGSSAYDLRWYQDRNMAQLPRPWVVSVPLLVYRGLMLAWALWLAFALLRWLRWGWECISTNGLWRSFSLKQEKN